MAEVFLAIVHLLGSCLAIIHLLGSRVARLALCIRGTLGKGTLRMYPSFRVPTHVLRACSFLRVPLLLSFPLENLSPRPRIVGWPELQFVVKEARALFGRKVLEAVVQLTWLRSG